MSKIGVTGAQVGGILRYVAWRFAGAMCEWTTEAGRKHAEGRTCKEGDHLRW